MIKLKVVSLGAPDQVPAQAVNVLRLDVSEAFALGVNFRRRISQRVECLGMVLIISGLLLRPFTSN